MEFRKTVKMELEDQLSLSFYVAKKQLILMPVLIVVLSIVLVLAMNMDSGIDGFLVLITLVVSIIFSGIIVLVSFLSLKHSSKKQFASNKSAQAPSDIVLDGEGVHVTNERGNVNLPWPDVYKAAEAKSSYFIFVSRAQAFVVPKRLLAPNEEETLRALLQQNITPKMCRLISH